MPDEVVLSPLDAQIFQELKANARIEDSELAVKLNVPESVVCERIKWLEDNDFIAGYTAIINWDAIDLSGLDEDDLKKVDELKRLSANSADARSRFNRRRLI